MKIWSEHSEVTLVSLEQELVSLMPKEMQSCTFSWIEMVDCIVTGMFSCLEQEEIDA
jgi:hypothetical protein